MWAEPGATSWSLTQVAEPRVLALSSAAFPGTVAGDGQEAEQLRLGPALGSGLPALQVVA